MEMMKVIIAVDYKYIREKRKNDLIYETVEIDPASYKRVARCQNTIDKIFSVDDPHAIARKIKTLVEKSYFSDEIMEFFNYNQWILRFAYKADVFTITEDSRFHVNNTIIPMPIGCYVAPNMKRVFTNDMQVPVWLKRKALETKNMLEWLILDDENTLAEKIEACILSDFKSIRELCIKHPWVLMQLELRNRISIMKRLNIPYSEVYLIKDAAITPNGKIIFDRVPSAIPEEMTWTYEKRNEEIKKLFLSDSGTFDSRLRDYYCSHMSQQCNDLILLYENLWILDHANPELKASLMKGLGLVESYNRINFDILGKQNEPVRQQQPLRREVSPRPEVIRRAEVPTRPEVTAKPEEVSALPTRKTVKFRTITKRINERDIHSYTIDVDPLDLERLEKLNQQLISLIWEGKGVADERGMTDLIKSDEDVLKIWPWVIDYITNPSYIVEILEASLEKKKKR